MKRPEIQRYIPPPLRSKMEFCEDKMENAKDKYVSETASMQPHSIGKYDSYQVSSSDIAQRRVRLDRSSSSSNPRHISDESSVDYDSSESSTDYCGYVPKYHLDIIKETTENNSNKYWEKKGRGLVKNDDDIGLANCLANANISSNSILEEYTDYSDIKSYSNQCLNSVSKETKFKKGLFYNYDDDSISDIEAVIDAYTKKGRVLTSTPYSDIADEEVLEAAKYVPTEESATESTLLGQNDTAIDTNIKDRYYNFEIYHDSPSVQNKTDHSEIIGGTYIPPPVPAPRSAVHLPIITRLPSYVLSSYQLYGPRPVSPQHISQWPIQQRHPQPVLSPSLRLCSDIPYRIYNPSPYSGVKVASYISPIPRDASSPVSLRSPNLPRMPSAVPAAIFPQERLNHPHSTQYTFHPTYLPQRISNPPNLEVHKQGNPFFIPPPAPVPQLIDGSQQINILNQRENVRSQRPLSRSFINKIVFDGKLQPQNPK